MTFFNEVTWSRQCVTGVIIWPYGDDVYALWWWFASDEVWLSEPVWGWATKDCIPPRWEARDLHIAHPFVFWISMYCHIVLHLFSSDLQISLYSISMTRIYPNLQNQKGKKYLSYFSPFLCSSSLVHSVQPSYLCMTLVHQFFPRHFFLFDWQCSLHMEIHPK